MADVDGAEHKLGTQRAYRHKDGMEYLVYVPPGSPQAAGWPVLLFLHGVGEASQNYSKASQRWTEQSLETVKAHGSFAALCAAEAGSRLHTSLIVISPQYAYSPAESERAQGRRTWQWVNKAGTIDEILGEVANRFNGDPQRIYLSGFSRGAGGAIAVATALKRHRAAKLLLVDSEFGLSQLPEIPAWVHYSGPNTVGAVVQTHRPFLTRLALERWEQAAPDSPAPRGDRVFTNWNLSDKDPTKNHTETSERVFADVRVYDWLLS